MRLLKAEANDKFSLVEFVDKDVPSYAILSHTWGKDAEEVTFQDLVSGSGEDKPGYGKILFCGKQAVEDGLQFFWVDTCCIDKSSSAELSEAINSMFRWYRNAARCYVYLSDVSIASSTGNGRPSQQMSTRTIQHSRWFTRSWTLQELVAPMLVEFFSVEGERLGDKTALGQAIREITGISIQALQGWPLSEFNVDERLSWADGRMAKREEDTAYSLLGIFDIHMPLLYGEGQKKAFARLFKEIEQSIIDEQSTLTPKRSMKTGCFSRYNRSPNIYNDFQQFNALGGIQNISTGNGNQFPGASLTGPVYLG
ncbi:hypothetical protein QQS21_006426 [Conoideocrella luteorostrata]|uniref:HET-domain-containing protein n=1 Tax=Conoideocrella luteorostrata TaxID=1105319 RepID=A0AAJ0CRW0_9HYPO|nr:hypothetical protein QQS21_006426 [Conoideocrella luteorostrata]